MGSGLRGEVLNFNLLNLLSFISFLFNLAVRGLQPLIKTQAESLNPHANLYYKIGEGITGNLHINIEVPETVDVAIVSK